MFDLQALGSPVICLGAKQREPPSLFEWNPEYCPQGGKNVFPPKNTYHLEFVSAQSLNRTDSATSLWFLELLERDVLGEVARGTEEAIAAKRAWLKEQGYGERWFTPSDGP
jgi:hypothetical protein